MQFIKVIVCVVCVLTCGVWSSSSEAKKTRRLSPSLSSMVGFDFPLASYLRYIPYIAKKRQHAAWSLWDRGSYRKGMLLLRRAVQTLRNSSQKHLAMLKLAQLAHSLSDHRTASLLYRKLLANRRLSIQWPARVLLARYLNQNLRPSQAWRVLRSWPLKAPKTNNRRKHLRLYWMAGHLLRAEAATRLGRRVQAQQSYRSILQAKALIADWVGFQELRLLAKQKKYKRLRGAALRWRKRYVRSRWRKSVRLLQARALEKLGHCRLGVRIYREVIRTAPRSLSRQAQLGEVRCLLLLHQKNRAYQKLRRMLKKMAGTWYGTQAMKQLQWSFPKRVGLQSLYDRGYHLYRARRWKKAALTFRKFLKKVHRKGRSRRSRRIAQRRRKRFRRTVPLAHYYLGRAMFRGKDYVACKRHLGLFVKKYPRHPLHKRARLVWIRANYRQKRNLSAVLEYEKFSKKNRGTLVGRLALWWAAQLYSEHKKEAKSIQLFRLYFQTYRGSRRRWEARIKMALVAYQRGRYRQTVRMLRPLVRKKSDTGVRALFWAGKAYEKLQKKGLARRFFRKIRPLSDSYYAARAQERLHRRPLLAKRPISLFQLIADQRQERLYQGQMARWFKRHFRSSTWASLHQSIRSKPAYQRAYVFALANRWRPVRQEWALLRRTIKSPLIYYMEARSWLAYGKPHRSMYYGHKFRAALPGKKRRSLPFRPMLRLTFPIPYPYWYDYLGKKYKVRPLLMLSLTRQESLFNPRIVSGAGARGIAQIMPKEGKRMAKKMGLRGYRTRHLYRVSLNLRMGFYHFGEYLRRHENDVELTLAAYNAGPRSLQRWLEKSRNLSKQDREAFIEYGIGFRETRRYVRNCLRWYSVYRQAFAKSRFRRSRRRRARRMD